MDLFETFKSAGMKGASVQQAIMTIVVAAVKADGVVSDEEISRVRAMCSLSPVFSRNTSDQDLALIRYANEVTGQLGFEAISKVAGSLNAELRETAFAFACDMVLSDGVLTDDEENYLNWLAGQLGVTEAVGRAVIWTTLIRNRSA